MSAIYQFILNNPYLFVYFILVLILFVIVFRLVSRQLLQLKNLRIKRLKKRKHIGSIESEFPGGNESAQTKKRGLESINRQFTITRRIFVPVSLLVFLVLGIFPVLGFLPAASLTFVIGTGTVLIGIIARPIIENIISGLVLSYSKVISIGDTVKIDGHYGSIEDINLFSTIVKTWDWRRYIIPNIKMIQNNFESYSLTDHYQWASVEFYISYENDVKRVEKLAIQAAKKSPYSAGKEEPTFWVMDMHKDSIKCWIAAWANSAKEAWELKNDIRTALVKSFQAQGIEIPYQRHKVES